MRTFTSSRFFDRSLLRTWCQLAVACLMLVFLVGAGDPAARYNQLGHQLMCTCGCNQVLLECNHVGCTVSTQEEAELRQALDRGDSGQLILQNFVQKYGEVVLAAPPKSGFNLVAWIAPALTSCTAASVQQELLFAMRQTVSVMPLISAPAGMAKPKPTHCRVSLVWRSFSDTVA